MRPWKIASKRSKICCFIVGTSWGRPALLAARMHSGSGPPDALIESIYIGIESNDAALSIAAVTTVANHAYSGISAR
jgi:hypothetical protein